MDGVPRTLGVTVLMSTAPACTAPPSVSGTGEAPELPIQDDHGQFFPRCPSDLEGCWAFILPHLFV